MSIPKPYVTYGAAAVLLFVLIAMFSGAFSGLEAPETQGEDFSSALWNGWGIAVIIVAFVIFAGGMGILVLLGGAWKWE